MVNKMVFNGWEHGYLYGKDYDLGNESFPDPNKDYDVVLCWNLKDENKRVLSSLEGMFLSNKNLAGENLPSSVNPGWKLVINRDKMREFEEKYCGKFIPFTCGEK